MTQGWVYVEQLKDLVAAQPFIVIACAALALFLATAMRAALRESAGTDPRRMFTADQRTAGFARAGGQCEYARWWFFRCTRTATHGDHYFPWSKGGATTMRNYVAACATCNTSKGARVPSRIDRTLMAIRRASYFPSGVPREPGEWFQRQNAAVGAGR